MYSMVVMMAMSASPEAVAWNGLFNRGCHGCTGYSSCTGVVYTGCTGTSCTGCTGVPYTGCTGTAYTSCTGCTGYSHGHSFKLFGGSCHGSTVYSSCHGCTGYSSCHGTTAYSSCTGCTGYTSCTGCTGHTRHGLFSGFMGRSSCHGSSCHGYTTGYGCTGYSSCLGCTGTVVTPAPVMTPVPETKKEMPKPETKKGETSAPATITLKVPADAKVTIDGVATTSTSEVRVFSTPNLAVGNTYTYVINASVTREGKVFSASKQVVVTPGETAELELNPAVVTTIVAR